MKKSFIGINSLGNYCCFVHGHNQSYFALVLVYCCLFSLYSTVPTAARVVYECVYFVDVILCATIPFFVYVYSFKMSIVMTLNMSVSFFCYFNVVIIASSDVNFVCSEFFLCFLPIFLGNKIKFRFVENFDFFISFFRSKQR